MKFVDEVLKKIPLKTNTLERTEKELIYFKTIL